jgi:hypothetical protein
MIKPGELQKKATQVGVRDQQIDFTITDAEIPNKQLFQWFEEAFGYKDPCQLLDEPPKRF